MFCPVAVHILQLKFLMCIDQMLVWNNLNQNLILAREQVLAEVFNETPTDNA